MYFFLHLHYKGVPSSTVLATMGHRLAVQIVIIEQAWAEVFGLRSIYPVLPLLRRCRSVALVLTLLFAQIWCRIECAWDEDSLFSRICHCRWVFICMFVSIILLPTDIGDRIKYRDFIILFIANINVKPNPTSRKLCCICKTSIR